MLFCNLLSKWINKWSRPLILCAYSEIQHSWTYTTESMFTYLLHANVSMHEGNIIQYTCYTVQWLPIETHPRLTANFIQFCFPATQGHYNENDIENWKNTLYRKLDTVSATHCSRLEDRTGKSWHSTKWASLRHSLKKENGDD